MAKHTCQQCGKEFEREPDKRANRCKFCCMPCYRASRKGSTPWNKGKPWSDEVKDKMRQAKLENPTKHWLGKIRPTETANKIKDTFAERWGFSGEHKGYPRYWTKTLKRSIRQRDCFKCSVCGAEEGKKAHHVHHIDYDKSNLSPENLITLCHSCHTRTNMARREYWTERLRKVVANG